jgi:hypothetical protein
MPHRHIRSRTSTFSQLHVPRCRGAGAPILRGAVNFAVTGYEHNRAPLWGEVIMQTRLGDPSSAAMSDN